MKTEEDSKFTDSKSHWVNLFNGFADMIDLVSPDLALFLFWLHAQFRMKDFKSRLRSTTITNHLGHPN